MGMLFTPLAAVSLIEIPREKMAQASGLTNTIRQLAGSFGVAILATLLSTRVKYHAQMFGEAINTTTPAFKQVSGNVTRYIMHHTGSNLATAAKQGQAVLSGHLTKQAYIQGINDDFLIAALITLAGAIPIFWIHTKKSNQHNHEKAVPHEL